MKRPNKQLKPVLFLNDGHGVHIPRKFATSWPPEERVLRVSGVTDSDWQILEDGPDGRDTYWEAWEEVCASATITDVTGNEYFIFQDGDCWLIPKGMTWDDEEDGWRWP